VSVTPATANLETGGSQQFTAQVTGTGDFNASVNWSVNGVADGNSTLGTITATGQYTAPATPPSPNNLTITATSVQDSTKSGSCAPRQEGRGPIAGKKANKQPMPSQASALQSWPAI